MKKVMLSLAMITYLLNTNVLNADAINQLAQGLRIIRLSSKSLKTTKPKLSDQKIKHFTKDGWERDNALIYAAEEADIDAIRYFLDQGIDVNTVSRYNTSALSQATAKLIELPKEQDAYLKAIRLLLEAGADPTSSPSAWELAKNKNSQLEKLLSDFGARDSNTATDLHRASTLRTKLDTTRYLKESGAVHQVDENWQTPLHFAVKSGTAENIKILLKHGALVNKPDKNGQTPLHIAATSGTPEEIEVLLQHGALINKIDKNEQTPLHIAAQSSKPKNIEVLLKYEALVNEKDKNGQTPLHVAVKSGCIECIDFLLKAKANIEAKDNNYNTPLHIAVTSKNLETTQKLLAAKANVDAINKDQQTPLLIAIPESINYNIVKELLKYNPKTTIKDKENKTPLDYALSNLIKFKDSPTEIEMVTKLLDKKSNIDTADPSDLNLLQTAISTASNPTVNLFLDKTQKKLPATANSSGQTLLHLGLLNQNIEPSTMKKIINKIDTAAMDKQDEKDNLPLHLAIKNNIPEITNLILKSTTNINAKNVEERTPLEIAVRYNQPELTKLLLKNNADTSITDKRGRTVLHFALMDPVSTENHKHDFIDILAKADEKLINQADQKGDTPLHIAAQYYDSKKIVQKLLQLKAQVDKENNVKKTPLDLARTRMTAELLLNEYNDPIKALEKALDVNVKLSGIKGISSSSIFRQLAKLKLTSTELEFINSPENIKDPKPIHTIWLKASKKQKNYPEKYTSFIDAFTHYKAIKTELEKEKPNYLTILQNIATQYTSATSFIPDLLSELGTTSEDLQFIAGKTVTTDLGKKLQTIYTSAKTQNNKEFVAQMLQYYKTLRVLGAGEEFLPEITGIIASYQ